MIIITSDEKELLRDLGDTVFGFAYSPDTEILMLMDGTELEVPSEEHYVVIEERGNKVSVWSSLEALQEHYDYV